MKPKIIFVLLMICFASQFSFAQKKIYTISCDTTKYKVYSKINGDTIVVACDSVYFLDKYTFNLIYNSYNEFRDQNLLLNEYTHLNDSISDLYESQLESQKGYFDSLNTLFNKLANSADTMVSESNKSLDSITKNLSTIESQIKDAKSNITNAQADIVAAKKQMRKQKWKWGAGGFTIGAVLTLVATILL